MRWTHKHLRKIGYTLLFMAWALPKVGFWIFVIGVVLFEVALSRKLFKFAVPLSDDKIKTKLKELSDATNKEQFIRQEAADRAGTALVDGFLYLWGPAILLIIATLNATLEFFPKELLEQLPPQELRRQMSLSTGGTLYFVSLWMMSQYLSRYAKTKRKLKEIGDTSHLKLYKALVGPVRPVCWALALLPIVLWKLTPASSNPYLAAGILMLPTLWPVIYGLLYAKAQKAIQPNIP